jgi:hypothetical protein
MAAIISLDKVPKRSGARRPKQEAGQTAAILFFTGVQVERLAEGEEPAPAEEKEAN